MAAAPQAIRAAVPLIKQAMAGFKRHRVPRMAAALAYYTLFSLAPLLLLLFAIAGFVVGDDAAQDTFLAQVEEVAGEDIAATLDDLVSARDGGTGNDVIASVFGLVLLFVGASGVFLQLQASLNTVWEIPIEETTGLVPMLWKRLRGFAAVLVLGIGLIVFTVGTGLVAYFADEIAERMPTGNAIIQVLNPLVAILGVSALMALVFRYLPARQVSWRVAGLGGLLTTVVIILGSAVIGVVFALSDPGASFGRFAAIVVLLVYIYYLAQAFFLGAEITVAIDNGPEN